MFRQQVFHFPIRYGNQLFQFCGVSGTLFTSNDNQAVNPLRRNLLRKIGDSLNCCMNPYLLSPRWNEAAKDPCDTLSSETRRLGAKYINKLIRLSRNQLLLARLYASWRVPLFANAREATLFFREYAEGDQEELCLPRALFAAKTSRRFAEEGTVVIGVFLPSRAMHAWVIEGDQIADPYDGIWINYQPIAMLS